MLNLSTEFAIDPNAPWVQKHNVEAAEVLAAHEADRPIRVPLISPDALWQHGFYMEEENLDFTSYYNDPEVMLRVQLEAARRRRELPICDFALGQAPEFWSVAIDQHPVIPYGWVGCELVFFKDKVPAYKGLNLSKKECRALPMPDPRQGGILKKIHDFWHTLKDRYEHKLSFLGRPVGSVYPFVDSYGIFDFAIAIRGQDIMTDMYEDPPFVLEFLLKLAEWAAQLVDIWGEWGGNSRAHFSMSDHGIDMLSPELYEQFIVPVIARMNKRRGAQPGTRLHHCGRGAHLFPIMKKHFGLTQIEALTHPYVDIARIRSEIGREVWIIGSLADDVVQLGPPERIRQSVQELMTSGAKDGGRFALEIGDMLPGAPLEHRLAYYEAVKEFGTY